MYDYITTYSSANYTPDSLVPKVYGRPRTIDGLTIHWWGNPIGQTFDGVARYLCRAGGGTSAHYVVTEGKVACIVAPRHAAWHAGNSIGNATTVGLELDPRATEGVYRTAAELIRDLRAEYGPDPLRPHNFWKATKCPGTFDLARLDRMARGLPTPVSTPVLVTPKPVPVPLPGRPAPKPGTWLPLVLDGDLGPRTITELERALERSRFYKGLVEQDHGKAPVFGPVLKEALQRFLAAKNYYRRGIDGDFGYHSVVALQTYLRDLKLYARGLDGAWGTFTTMALQQALNGKRMG